MTDDRPRGSVTGFFTIPVAAIYSSTKHALESITVSHHTHGSGLGLGLGLGLGNKERLGQVPASPGDLVLLLTHGWLCLSGHHIMTGRAEGAAGTAWRQRLQHPARRGAVGKSSQGVVHSVRRPNPDTTSAHTQVGQL